MARYRLRGTLDTIGGESVNVDKVRVVTYLEPGQLIASTAVSYVQDPVYGYVASGVLKDMDGTDGIELLADTADLNLAGPLWYKMTFAKATTSEGDRVSIKPIFFPASTSTAAVDLEDLLPMTTPPDVTVGTQVNSIDILDSTTVGRNVLTASSQATARTAIGVTSSGGGTVVAADITDATTVGRNVLIAASQAAARTAIGAGTSDLAIGTTGTTAAAGNDARLSDQRTPLNSSVTIAKFTATGTANSNTTLHGDNVWRVPTGGGDTSTNTAVSVDSEVVLFSGTSGKTLKRSTISGIPKLTSGVIAAAAAGTDYSSPGSTETLTNKTINGGNNTLTGIGVTSLSATGTRDSTTVLHGDNVFRVPAGGGGGLSFTDNNDGSASLTGGAFADNNDGTATV